MTKSAADIKSGDLVGVRSGSMFELDPEGHLMNGFCSRVGCTCHHEEGGVVHMLLLYMGPSTHIADVSGPVHTFLMPTGQACWRYGYNNLTLVSSLD